MVKHITVGSVERYMDNKGYHYNSLITNKNEMISGYSSLQHYKKGTLTWIKKAESVKGIDISEISFVIAQTGLDLNSDRVIYCDESKAVFFGIIDELLDPPSFAGIGSNSYISENVKIGRDVVIGSNCVLDGDIEIGDRTRIMDGTVIINHCKIGKNTTIQPLCAIGIDGFGYYENDAGQKTMIKHHGGVIIGDNVFIGSHTNIARGTLDDTIISDDVKIAPSTHIGHNNYVGKSSTIICSDVYGSCYIGNEAYITACTIENQHIIGNHALVGMGAVVTKDVEPDTVVVGIPAKFLRMRDKHDV